MARAHISNYLSPSTVFEKFWKKSEKSGKSRKSGGKVPISGERIGVKSPLTRRFSLLVGTRTPAKFEPDRSSRLKVHSREIAGFQYVRARYGRNFIVSVIGIKRLVSIADAQTDNDFRPDGLTAGTTRACASRHQ